jgi:alpha-glucosidase
MNMKKSCHFHFPLAFVIALAVCASLFGKEYDVLSHNKNLKMTVSVQDGIIYRITFRGKEIVSSSPISMSIRGVGILGKNPKVKRVRRRSVDETIIPVVRVKSKSILDRYEEMSMDFAGGYGIDFRVYDDGAAYRFRTDLSGTIQVVSEEAVFRFAGDHSVYFPTEESFLTHSERLYEVVPLSSIPSEKMACLPVLVDVKDGPKIAVTETDLRDYPGMYLTGNSDTSLRGKYPAVALKEKQTRDRTVEVAERADYIAETDGKRTFPWRVLVVAEKDGDLIESQIVFKLAEPCRIEDTSWIRPGKVAWDWWNANNVYGVDFRAGINTETYKHYIDFASRYGIEYVILDEGWSKTDDLFSVNPDIDMETLLRHAKEKGVGLILWVVWKTLDDQLDEALDLFERWGVKGIKVDFMQRDDQWMVTYYWRIASEAAKRHLLVDFHGSYKPCGLRRAYPNVLTREGVRGLENVKWSNHPTPEHDVTLPFIRMLAGPMDYTPGAMVNAQEKDFRPIFDRPMSMGTRCHQLAMYVVFESPLQMLADSPSNYLREEECMDFLSRVPTVWDETVVLDARVAEYVLVARKHGEVWYVGAMTDWTPRELIVDFFFLDEGSYIVDVYRDGINADRIGNDYEKIVRTISREDRMTIGLAPGGGWAARITRVPGK